jgi:phage-related protein
MSSIVKGLTDLVQGVFNIIYGTIATIVNTVLGTFEAAINFVVSLIKGVFNISEDLLKLIVGTYSYHQPSHEREKSANRID